MRTEKQTNDDHEWLEIFAKDNRGGNFISIVTNIDIGFVEFWEARFAVDEDEGEIYFFTQYNPMPFCDHEPCWHFPRNHLDDYIITLEGEVIADGAQIIDPESRFNLGG